MKNKKIKIIFMLTYILFVTLAVKAFAKEIYDMQKINVNVIKPISKFEIEYEMPNGEKSIITSNSKYYSSDEFEFDQEANKILLMRGTKIKVKDLSEAGSGNKIVEYDFQIYKPSSSELINSRNVKDLEKEIILDEEGTYSFYLSVMDDYKNIEGFDNWSVNGNHRWLSEDKNRKGIFFYWYFIIIYLYLASLKLNQKELQLN